MCKCITCGNSFELADGLNPFYCSQLCADIKNAEPDEVAVDDPNAHIRKAHKANRKMQPRKRVDEGLNGNNLLTKSWTGAA